MAEELTPAGGSDSTASDTNSSDTSTSEPGTFAHIPVMLDEIMATFDPVPPGTYVDATLGGGGHAEAMLSRRDDLHLVGIDRDRDALAAAGARLAKFGDRVTLAHGRFDEFDRIVGQAVNDADVPPVSAVLFDLGVSSPQLDRADRGFSYRDDGPLDMRMNRTDGEDSARDTDAGSIVNGWSKNDLARLIGEAGDERFASRIAAAIIAARPISTTTELAEIVRTAIPAATRRTGGHPAKRTFQALRIAVNDELTQIEPALLQAIRALVPGGRGAVLAYHSGEDRLVKRTIQTEEDGGCTCPQNLPCVCDAEPTVTALSPRLRRPSEGEIASNPRSRSARLRCFEKIAAGPNR